MVSINNPFHKQFKGEDLRSDGSAMAEQDLTPPARPKRRHFPLIKLKLLAVPPSESMKEKPPLSGGGGE